MALKGIAVAQKQTAQASATDLKNLTTLSFG